jgi:DNA phosphorothioation-dependent restriction protein DptH
VLGESGTGKTYSISCMIAELARQGVASVVLDYGQGFTHATLLAEFIAQTRPLELNAAKEGLGINPLQLFPSDIQGPVNVAQRVADTFARVYRGIGIQQHSAIRQAALDAFASVGVRHGDEASWQQQPPTFDQLLRSLEDLANDDESPHARYAAAAASHISTMFVFNTFRPRGLPLAWGDLLQSADRPILLQLNGLEHSLETAVTEFVLWNLIGYIESLGPGPLRCFVVLDEAHKLSFDRGSPVEKFVREGRKFGLGLILASQQPEDFSAVAFANTATKLVFQVSDERTTVSRALHRKVRNAHSLTDIAQLITRLPRGCAYVVTENIGRITRIASFSERIRRWKNGAPRT